MEKGYKIVTGKLRREKPVTNIEIKEAIGKLFIIMLVAHWQPVATSHVTEFTVDELQKAAQNDETKKQQDQMVFHQK